MEAKKVYLNGKYILIDTENLEGYFTFNEANSLAKRNGKRLMTNDEQKALSECISVWNEKRKGRDFYIPADESLDVFVRVFLPAAGCSYINTGTLDNVGLGGYYWSSSPNSADLVYYLYLNSCKAYPSCSNYRISGFSVRLVKDV